MTNAQIHAALEPMHALGTFDEAEHKYHWNGTDELLSVTRSLHRWEKEFDAEGMAARIALRDGKTTEEVLAEWEAGRESAAAMGHDVHSNIEGYLLGEGGWRAGHLTGIWNRTQRWLAWWDRHGARLEVVAVELRVFSPRYQLAGTMDLLARNRDTGHLHILDWKTNKRFRTGRQGYEPLLAPFQDLMANEHSKYSLQIAIYRAILEEWGIPTNGGTLVWIPPAGPATHFRALDLKDRVQGALA